jgi:hypothetical protein
MVPYDSVACSTASAGPVWARQHGLPADPAAIRPHTPRHRILCAEYRMTPRCTWYCDGGFLGGLQSLERDTPTSDVQPAKRENYTKRPWTVPQCHYKNDQISQRCIHRSVCAEVCHDAVGTAHHVHIHV